jgi:hypothetical protein
MYRLQLNYGGFTACIISEIAKPAGIYNSSTVIIWRN